LEQIINKGCYHFTHNIKVINDKMIHNNSDSDELSTSSMEENEYNFDDDSNKIVRTNDSNITRIFKQNELETKNDCVLLNVRRTIREFIFPKIKFINNDALSRVKLVEDNNILHILLRELNRLDDSVERRARFWLRYKSQVSAVLTARKTEIANGMKKVVFEGKLWNSL